MPVCTLAAHRGHEIAGDPADGSGRWRTWSRPARGVSTSSVSPSSNDKGHPTLRHVLVLDEDAEGRSRHTRHRHRPGYRAEDGRKGIQHTIDPDDVAVFQLSGGTTGVPKVIPRLHAEYWYNAAEYARSWNWGPDSRIAHVLPIIHNAGVVCAMHGAHSVGGCLVLGVPDLDASLPMLAAEGITHVLLGQAHYAALAAPGFAAAARSLKEVVLSGTKVPPLVFDELENVGGLWSGQLFGMGEGLLATTRPRAPRRARATTVGTPISPLDEVRGCWRRGRRTTCPTDRSESCCRGRTPLRGYFDAPEHNARAFTSDGFYRTGDLASIQAIEGGRFLSIEGRIKDLINRGGEKVNAEEVELLLLRHPRVEAAAVVAMPDPRLGERTCAYLVVGGEPLTIAEVQRHFAELQVAKFKSARAPRTSAGAPAHERREGRTRRV